MLLLAISSQKVYSSRQRYREPVISGVLSPYTGIHPHGVGRLIIWVSINLHNDKAMIIPVCNIRAEKMANVSSKDLLVKLGINDLPTILKERRLRWWVIIHMLWEVSSYGCSSTCCGKSLYMGIHQLVVGSLFIWVFIHMLLESLYMGNHPHVVGSHFIWVIIHILLKVTNNGYPSTCCWKSLYMGIHQLVVGSHFISVFINTL